MLRPVEPLAAPSEPATFATWYNREHASAIKSEGRARCQFKQSVRLGAPLDEQHRLRATMEAERARLDNLYLTLCRKLSSEEWLSIRTHLQESF